MISDPNRRPAPPQSKKKFFALDDRGIGGTHMIQQQFVDMHRKVEHARKHVDNEPPTVSMFKRPNFSSFGVDYRERVKVRTLPHVTARIDTSPPDSFHLLKNLYINRRVRSKYASPVRSPREGATAGRNGERSTAETVRSAIQRSDDDRGQYQVPTAVRNYAATLTTRLDEIAHEKALLQQRRLLSRSSRLTNRGVTGLNDADEEHIGHRRSSLQEAAEAALLRQAHEPAEYDVVTTPTGISTFDTTSPRAAAAAHLSQSPAADGVLRRPTTIADRAVPLFASSSADGVLRRPLSNSAAGQHEPTRPAPPSPPPPSASADHHHHRRRPNTAGNAGGGGVPGRTTTQPFVQAEASWIRAYDKAEFDDDLW